MMLSNSAVGMLRRLASLWVSASTSIVLFLVLLMVPSCRLTIEELIDQFSESSIHLVDGGEFRELPSPKFQQVVDARNPVGAHGVRLFLGVLAAIALHLYDKIQ